MFSNRLEITVDLSASWPKERLGAFYKVLTTRLALTGDQALTELFGLGFACTWLACERATLRVHDKEFDVDLSCSLGEKPEYESDPGLPQLSGLRVLSVDSHARVIPLPPQLWQPFDRCCGCPWCVGRPGYFDALGVDNIAKRQPAPVQLLHVPQLQRKVDRLRITVNALPKITPEALAELYAAVVSVHVPNATGTPDLQSVKLHPSWYQGSETVWTGAQEKNGNGVFLEVLPRDVPPEGESPYKLSGLMFSDAQGLVIPLPKSLWRQVEKSVLGCGCHFCHKEPSWLDTLWLSPYGDWRPRSPDITELRHVPVLRKLG